MKDGGGYTEDVFRKWRRPSIALTEKEKEIFQRSGVLEDLPTFQERYGIRYIPPDQNKKSYTSLSPIVWGMNPFFIDQETQPKAVNVDHLEELKAPLAGAPRDFYETTLRVPPDQFMFKDDFLLVPMVKGKSHEVTIGRRDPTESIKSSVVYVERSSVSRSHIALFVGEDGSVAVMDLSRNGTWVNKKEIPPDTKVQVHEGDIISLSRKVNLVFKGFYKNPFDQGIEGTVAVFLRLK